MSRPSAYTYSTWARELRMRDWGLDRSHGTVLRLLVDYADPNGRCEVGVKKLATTLEWSREYVHRLLREIENAGLVKTVRRGAGNRAAVRQLRIDAQPVVQLQLHVETAPAESVTSDCDRELGNVNNVTSRGHKKSQEGQGEGARTRETTDTAAVAPTLERVCAILADAPGVVVLDPPRDPSVNHALLGHPEPEYDHERAAHTVASWAHEGGLWSSSAPRLLSRALLKQTEAGRARVNRLGAPGPAKSAAKRGKSDKPWEGALERAFAEAQGAEA